MSVVPSKASLSKLFSQVQGGALDIAERALSTFVVVLAPAVALPEFDVFNFASWKAAVLAAAAAAFSVAKNAIVAAVKNYASSKA